LFLFLITATKRKNRWVDTPHRYNGNEGGNLEQRRKRMKNYRYVRAK
jgi:hypothetical protein